MPGTLEILTLSDSDRVSILTVILRDGCYPKLQMRKPGLERLLPAQDHRATGMWVPFNFGPKGNYLIKSPLSQSQLRVNEMFATLKCKT